VRLVAATHRDLKQMVSEGRFRSDLYFRLNIFPVSALPLRERREDIPLLVKFFAEDCVSRINRRVKTIPANTIRVLAEYDWPGNVRELQNFIERAVILSPGSELRAPLEDLDWSKQVAQPQPETLAQAEYGHILRALKESGWVVGGPRVRRESSDSSARPSSERCEKWESCVQRKHCSCLLQAVPCSEDSTIRKGTRYESLLDNIDRRYPSQSPTVHRGFAQTLRRSFGRHSPHLS
jgi:transcriptional regulator with AAA-type ATPase domain